VKSRKKHHILPKRVRYPKSLSIRWGMKSRSLDMWTSRNGPLKQRNTAYKDTETKGLIQWEALSSSVFWEFREPKRR